jgi:hypothetical protein
LLEHRVDVHQTSTSELSANALDDRRIHRRPDQHIGHILGTNTDVNLELVPVHIYLDGRQCCSQSGTNGIRLLRCINLRGDEFQHVLTPRVGRLQIGPGTRLLHERPGLSEILAMTRCLFPQARQFRFYSGGTLVVGCVERAIVALPGTLNSPLNLLRLEPAPYDILLEQPPMLLPRILSLRNPFPQIADEAPETEQDSGLQNVGTDLRQITETGVEPNVPADVRGSLPSLGTKVHRCVAASTGNRLAEQTLPDL